jgi:hypothetical protein
LATNECKSMVPTATAANPPCFFESIRVHSSLFVCPFLPTLNIYRAIISQPD